MGSVKEKTVYQCSKCKSWCTYKTTKLCIECRDNNNVVDFKDAIMLKENDIRIPSEARWLLNEKEPWASKNLHKERLCQVWDAPTRKELVEYKDKLLEELRVIDKIIKEVPQPDQFEGYI